MEDLQPAGMETEAPARSAPFDRRALGLFVGVGVVVGAWYAFVVTHGSMRFAGREPEWRVFPALWQSLTHGRFDIPPADIPGEGFRRDGRTYTYFGLFPALLRGVASAFVDLEHGGLSQASSALAALTTFLSFFWVALRYRLDRGRRAPWFALYVATIAFATPALFGLALADVYDEAILWGAAWGSVFNAALLCFALDDSRSRTANRALVVMAVAAGLGLMTRVTSGLCSGLQLAGVLAWIFRDAMRGSTLKEALRSLVAHRAVVFAVSVGLAFCAAQAFVNYERWGNPLEFRPLQRHELFTGTERGRLELAHGQFALDRIPVSVCFYLLPDPGSVLPHWPFLVSGARRCFSNEAAYEQLAAAGWQITGEKLQPTMSPYYDLIEGPRMPMTIASPALLLFALAGCWRTRFRVVRGGLDRAAMLLLFALLLMSGLLLTLDALALRYELDLVPALAGLGLVALLSGGGPFSRAGRRTAAISGAAVLVAWSIMATQVTTLIVKTAKRGVPRPFREAIENTLYGG